MFRKRKKHKSRKSKTISTPKVKKKTFGMNLSEVMDICENIPMTKNIKVFAYHIK